MSRRFVDQSFFVPRTPVGLVVLRDSVESFLLREILESLHAVVVTHFVGTPSDFLAVLQQDSDAPPYLVISAHGDENGFVMGEYIDEIDTSVLKDGSLPASSLEGIIRLPGTVVFSTACESGRPEFAKAFLSGGARAYIASDELPHGCDVPLVAHMLFHRLLHAGDDLATAWRHTTEHVEAAREFKLFSEPHS